MAKSTCTTCGGGGIAPASNCTCKGPSHTCTPRTCRACGGSGQR